MCVLFSHLPKNGKKDLLFKGNEDVKRFSIWSEV